MLVAAFHRNMETISLYSTIEIYYLLYSYSHGNFRLWLKTWTDIIIIVIMNHFRSVFIQLEINLFVSN